MPTSQITRGRVTTAAMTWTVLMANIITVQALAAIVTLPLMVWLFGV